MDSLKGLIWLESMDGIEKWCLAVEDPENQNRTRVFRCFGEEARPEHINGKSSNKKGGHWKFKAFRFNGNIEKMEVIERPLIKIIPDIPTNLYQYFPITELKKLEGWKWTD